MCACVKVVFLSRIAVTVDNRRYDEMCVHMGSSKFCVGVQEVELLSFSFLSRRSIFDAILNFDFFFIFLHRLGKTLHLLGA